MFKEKILVCIEMCECLLHKIRFKLHKKEGLGIDSLAPTDELEKGDVYLKMLNHAISDENIFNIAISGEYGSGKSSIIKSFKKQFTNYKTISISLANFLENHKIENDELEKNILKQLFYKVASKRIPNSRFVKIRDIKFRKVLLVNLSILVCSGPLLVVANTSFLNDFEKNCKTIKDFIENLVHIDISVQALVFILVGSFLISFLFLAFMITKVVNNFNMKGIKNSKYIEFELDKKDDIKAFDKYIDELIYFFKRNKYDVVFFEDLDRFDDISIFTRLRELNILVNESEEVNSSRWKKKRVKFVYAIKDDIFLVANKKIKKNEGEPSNQNEIKKILSENILTLEHSKNRTKFFDFIIPIIPAIDTNNSYAAITELFKNYNNIHTGINSLKISQELKNDISIYISDNRLLRNTFNEFIIYYQKMESSIRKQEGGILDKLFAIILYKNLYPNDFSCLKMREGELYNILNNKKNIIIEKKAQIENLIKVKKIEIEKLEELKLITEDIFLKSCKFELLNRSISAIQINDNSLIRLDDIKNEHLRYIKDKDNFYYTQYNRGGYYQIATKDVFLNNENNENILEYLDDINNEKKKEKLLQEIRTLEQEKLEQENKSLKELLADGQVSLKTNGLINVLLRRGYISEDYNEYISLFVPGQITNEENEFLKNISSGNEDMRAVKIINLEEVFKKIHLDDISRMSALNYDLLEFILINLENKKYEAKGKKYLNTLAVLDDVNLQFINEFSIQKESSFNRLIKELAGITNELFYNIIKATDSILQGKVFNSLVQELPLKVILEQNFNNCLHNYLLKFSELSNSKILIDENEKIIKLIKELKIKFENMDMPIYSDDENENEKTYKFIEVIYEENLYEINKQMLTFLIEGYVDDEVIKEKGINRLMAYEEIIKNELSELKKYIDSNIEEYLETVLLKVSEIEKIELEVAIGFLNNEKVSFDIKKKLIELKDFEISKLDTIVTKETWDTLLEYKKIKVSYNNVMSYYDSYKLSEILIQFLNDSEVANDLKNSEIDNPELEEDVILNNKISNDILGRLLPTFRTEHSYFDKSLRVIDDERIGMLINEKIIVLSEDIYKDVYTHANFITLIEDNLDEYINHIELYKLKKGDLKILLDSNNISDESKEIILLNIPLVEFTEDIYEYLKKKLMGISSQEAKVRGNYIKKCEIQKVLNNIKEKPLNDIKRSLDKIDTQYHFAENKGYFSVDDDDVLVEFLDKLEEYQIISTSTFVNGKYKINRKQVSKVMKK